MNKVLELKNLNKSFIQGGVRLDILKDTGLSVGRGEIVGLIGPSGSGKSTLLQIAGLLDKSDSGQILIGGESVKQGSESVRTGLRCNNIGFVYQFHHLMPDFTALENLVIPQMIANQNRAEAEKRAEDLLEMVGLKNRATHHPSELSGGEQQRIAIVRALVNAPDLLLADEPTGNLDPNTSEEVFDLLLKIVRQAKIGALIATHNIDMAYKMDRVLELKDGKVNPA